MKRISIFVSCILFISAGKCFAVVELPKYTREAGVETYYFKYKEPSVMREQGVFSGVTGAYTYHNGIMLKAEGRGAIGQVDYKNSGTLDNIDDFTLEFRGLGGYDLDVFTATVVTPYIGLGYRYLNDDSKGKITSTGAAGYERESNYLYTPIGIETLTELNNRWFFGVNLEYDYFWKGVQKSHLSDVDRGFNDLENDQNKGYGVRGSIKLVMKGERLDFVIEPFVRYWNIDKSEEQNLSFSGVLVGFGYEPKNHTIESGLKLGVGF